MVSTKRTLKNTFPIILITVAVIWRLYWFNFLIASFIPDYGHYIFHYIPNLSFSSFNVGYTPTDFDGTTWISETPEIKLNIISGEAKGYIVINGEEIYIEAKFVAMNSTCYIYAGEKGDYGTFRGDCSYFKDRCEIKVYLDEDKIFNGKYKTITLYKVN